MNRLVPVFLLFLASCVRGSDEPAKIVAPAGAASAVFSGGCFWCIQPPFDDAKGVYVTYVGYCGGNAPNPTYGQVSTGGTGYRESIEVFYDPAQISYKQLLDIFWHNIDPTQPDGQFYDIGSQYTTAIYYSNDGEKREATASLDALQNSGKFKGPIATKILPLTKFWPAEEHHQRYSRKNPEQYGAYHGASGREGFFQQTWGAGR